MRRPLSTRDIATMAVLASLGGVMSAYIGYLGVALNKLTGTPFGAGQFLAGLHVLWMVLALVLTNRVGVGTATGALKGTVELLAGSGKGVLVLLLSITAGLIVDAVWAVAPRRGMVTIAIAGGLGTASNVIVFLLFTSTYEGLAWLFVILLVVAFVSGVSFAGLLVANICTTLAHAGIPVGTPGLDGLAVSGSTGPPGAPVGRPPSGPRPTWTRRASLGALVTVVAAVLLFGGALTYYVAMGDNVENLQEGVISVEGNVDDLLTFRLEDFAGEEVTVEAELVGEFTHVDMRPYTGIPLRAVLLRVGVGEDATVVHVVGADGYGEQLDFDLSDVMDEEGASGFILVEEHGALFTGGNGDFYRLVCRDLDGGWWVRWVVRLTIE